MGIRCRLGFHDLGTVYLHNGVQLIYHDMRVHSDTHNLEIQICLRDDCTHLTFQSVSEYDPKDRVSEGTGITI